MVTSQRLIHPDLLRGYIKARGLSQRGLARAVDCHFSFINHLCVGRNTKATTELATAIARELEVDITVLFVPVVSRGFGHQSRMARLFNEDPPPEKQGAVAAA